MVVMFRIFVKELAVADSQAEPLLYLHVYEEAVH